MGYEFFKEKIIFPSAPVPGINNDQSLTFEEVSKFSSVNTANMVLQLRDDTNF